jgi:hypothetical protein
VEPRQRFEEAAWRLKLQIRVEAINALNYTVQWNPNVDPRNATFGFINQDRNNPRDIQIGARFSFEQVGPVGRGT